MKIMRRNGFGLDSVKEIGIGVLRVLFLFNLIRNSYEEIRRIILEVTASNLDYLDFLNIFNY